MINLLPPDEKKQLRAARANVLLLRYNFLTLAAVIFLVISLAVVYFSLFTQQQNALGIIESNSKREASYQSVKQEADKFRAELSGAKSVLDSQASYSKAIIRIANLFPAGTALKDKLELTDITISTPVIMTVKIKDEASATRLLDSFKSSPYVTSITKNKIGIGEAEFPYTMEVSVLFKKEVVAP